MQVGFTNPTKAPVVLGFACTPTSPIKGLRSVLSGLDATDNHELRTNMPSTSFTKRSRAKVHSFQVKKKEGKALHTSKLKSSQLNPINPLWARPVCIWRLSAPMEKICFAPSASIFCFVIARTIRHRCALVANLINYIISISAFLT